MQVRYSRIAVMLSSFLLMSRAPVSKKARRVQLLWRVRNRIPVYQGSLCYLKDIKERVERKRRGEKLQAPC